MSMKKILSLLCAAILAFPAVAQGTMEDLTTDFRGRISAGIDKKLVRRLHLSAGFEARFRDNFTTPGRLSAEVGLSYKFNKYLKANVSYTFMEQWKSSSAAWYPRHRATVGLTGTLRAGYWSFQLRERFQATYQSDVTNTFQEPKVPLYLKSRFKVSYKGFQKVEPYAYADLRLLMNGANFEAVWNTSLNQYTSYRFLNYSNAYFNRYRGALGAVWKINKKNALDFYLMLDYCYDKNIDTNKAGTTLKSFTIGQALNTTAGINYEFSF